MFKSLDERLEERKAEYDKLVRAEHKAQRVIDQLSVLQRDEKNNVTVYEGGCYFYLYPSSVEEAELEYLPAIAEVTGEKWNKVIAHDQVEYRLCVYTTGWYSCFTVQPKVEGTCRIIARATGKVRKVSKYVMVEEPEIEYLVDCGEEGETDE